jgi:hypothetical protein
MAPHGHLKQMLVARLLQLPHQLEKPVSSFSSKAIFTDAYSRGVCVRLGEVASAESPPFGHKGDKSKRLLFVRFRG